MARGALTVRRAERRAPRCLTRRPGAAHRETPRRRIQAARRGQPLRRRTAPTPSSARPDGGAARTARAPRLARWRACCRRPVASAGSTRLAAERARSGRARYRESRGTTSRRRTASSSRTRRCPASGPRASARRPVAQHGAANVASAVGSGRRSRRRETPDRARTRVGVPRARAARASGPRSQKNGNGVVAPHSSPMKSSGGDGARSRTAIAARSARGGTRAARRSPSARLPTWSWFWRKVTKAVGGRCALGSPRAAPPRKGDGSPW